MTRSNTRKDESANTQDLTANANYEKVRDAFRAKLAKLTTTDALGRYELAGFVYDMMKDPDKYGKASVETLAEDVGFDDSTLYEWASVAKTFNKAKIRDLLEERNEQKQPISWSHVVELAKLTDGRKRQRHQRAVIKQGLSVAKLKSSISAENDAPSADPIKAAKIEKDAERSLKDRIRHGKGTLDGCLSKIRNLEETVLDRLDQSERGALEDQVATFHVIDETLDEIASECAASREKIAPFLTKKAPVKKTAIKKKAPAKKAVKKRSAKGKRTAPAKKKTRPKTAAKGVARTTSKKR